MEHFTTSSQQETFQLAANFARCLRPGDVLFLRGELGAGKTVFCSGLAQGLGCIDPPSSPTYAIVNLYRGPQPLAHFDMYRIQGEEDLDSTGYYDYLDQGAVLAVEWSENIAPFTDAPHYIITLEKTGSLARSITIEEAAL